MKEFIERWKTDSKYRAKMQLIFYGSIFLIAIIFARSSGNESRYFDDIYDDLNQDITQNNTSNNNQNKSIIELPDKYKYNIEITIDDNNYKYYGEKTNDMKTITKDVDGTITNYIYKNNDYYVSENDNYVLTTKDDIYDKINYTYISYDNINMYLGKAKKEDKQYLVYLKDIILGNESDRYFVILVEENKINIDYTPLMKEFNSSINTYKVNIDYEEIE